MAVFSLPSGARLLIEQGDRTKTRVDAIVNAANEAGPVAIEACLTGADQLEEVRFVLFNDDLHAVWDSTARSML